MKTALLPHILFALFYLVAVMTAVTIGAGTSLEGATPLVEPAEKGARSRERRADRPRWQPAGTSGRLTVP